MTTVPNIASRYLQRRVLLLSLVPLGMLFALTVTLAKTYHAREEGLVQEWFARGNSDMLAGEPSRALEDFRNALSYDPENNFVQLRLAEALSAGGRLAEARSYFLNLWERAPGSGEVNLDLAHLSIRTGESDQAIRYFRGAIYGSWEKDPSQRRRDTRLELCEFLLSQGRANDAQAEIGGLVADTPSEDGALHDKAGWLYLAAGAPNRALVEFETALRSNPRESQWLGDAGKAAYEAGDYATAEKFLVQAVRQNPSNEHLELLDSARDVQDGDPFLPGLSDEAQASRTWRAFQQGLDRLTRCSAAGTTEQPPGQPTAGLQPLKNNAQDLKLRVNLKSLERHPELRGEVMQFVFRIERSTAQACGSATGEDQALILIDKRHSGSYP